MELIDIVDENDNITGEIKDRDYVHNNNLYHRHVSCFILNNNGEVLLQRRSMTKKKNPGIWSRNCNRSFKKRSKGRNRIRNE